MKVLRYLYLFVLGFLSFLVSQILIRIPLLGILTKNPKFVIFQINNALKRFSGSCSDNFL